MVDGNLWLKRAIRLASVAKQMSLRILKGRRIVLIGCTTCLLFTGCSDPSAYQIPPDAKPTWFDKLLAKPYFQLLGRSGMSLAKSPRKAELTIPDHPAVEAWVKCYTGKQRRSFEAILERSLQYVVPMERIFAEEGLPKDLVFLALVESGFSPTARSPANAVGMYQFIAATGKRFGLQHTTWIDERLHPLKSARAAAAYLSFLYRKFDSWPLALAAYNCGENALQGAINRSGLQTFWQLIDKGYLPGETRQFVPKILAAIRILRRPERYGFDYDRGEWSPLCRTVSVPSGLSLSWLSKRAEIPLGELRKCNPELLSTKTPPDQPDYGLCVPPGKFQLVAALAADGGKSDKAAVTAHKVSPGDTLYAIAEKYGTSIAALATENNMRPSEFLKIGQLLSVPLERESATAKLDG